MGGGSRERNAKGSSGGRQLFMRLIVGVPNTFHFLLRLTLFVFLDTKIIEKYKKSLFERDDFVELKKSKKFHFLLGKTARR